MLHFPKSASMKRQTHLYLVWPGGEYILIFKMFIFGCSIPLKQAKISVNEVSKYKSSFKIIKYINTF